MAKVSLSKRLSKQLEMIEEGLPLWDICCDHGKVGQMALLENLVSEVTFVDSSLHAIRDLEKEVTDLRARFVCQEMQSFSPLRFKANFLISGVGAHLTLEILESFGENLSKFKRLILCVHQKNDYFYQKLESFPLKLVRKEELAEGKRRFIISSYSGISS